MSRPFGYLPVGVWIFATVVLLFNGGCTTELHSEKDLYKWLNNETHGFVKTKKADGLLLTAKYLPASYLVYKEYKSGGAEKSNLDSLYGLYNQTHAILLLIQPDTSSGASGDVAYKGIEGYGGYKERVMQLNFKLGEYLVLKEGTRSVPPLLTNMENTYSMVDKRSFYLVFPAAEATQPAQDLDLVFTDEIFGTGIHHFVFAQEDLKKMPKLTFLPAERSKK